MLKNQKILKYLPLLLICFPLSSCTPEKAKALRIGAIQFKSESIACIDSIDNMRQRELEPVPRNPEEIREEFINNILNSSRILEPIDPLTIELTPDEQIDLAIDPYTIELTPEAQEKWQKFMDDLTFQYSVFASIYDDLEQGSFLAKDSVEKSKEYAGKLTIQMGAFANLIDQYPPRLLQHRNDVIDKIDRLQDEYTNASSSQQQEIRANAGSLMEQWQQIKSEEEKIKNETVKQCLQAAVMGKKLENLIDEYDQLDLDTINTIIAGILDAVGSIAGQDYSTLKQQSSDLIAQIKADEILVESAEIILAEVNKALEGRNSQPEGNNSPSSHTNDEEILAELRALMQTTNQ